MRVLITVLIAASLFSCTAKVDAPAIDWSDPGKQGETPLNPTSTLDLNITKGTTTNINKFELKTSSTSYNVYYAYKATAATSLIFSNEVRQTVGCDLASYDSAYEWRELSSAGAIVTTTPVKLGESYILKKDVGYEFVVKLSKMSCSSILHSFVIEQP